MGVAALSSPNMLAAMFMKMAPVAGCPLGMSGNRRTNNGLSQRANTDTTPPRSPMRMMPSQSANTPVSPNEISKAVLAEAKVDSTMAGNTAVSPQKTSFAKAMRKATTKKAIQM